MTKYIKGQPIEITVSGTVAQDLDTSERSNYVLHMDMGNGERHYVSGSVLNAADSILLGPVPVTLPTEPGIYVHENRGATLPFQRTSDDKWFIVPMEGGAARRVFQTNRMMDDHIRMNGPIVKVA